MINKYKKKTCPFCKEKYTPRFSTLQKTCLKHECNKGYLDFEKAKKQRKLETQIPHITPTQLQKVINAVAREIDKYEPCISCQSTKSQMSAGHYHTAGGHESIRFNLHNIHKQCWYNCNKNRHGNIPQYSLGLVERYGRDYFDNVLHECSVKYPKLSKLDITEAYIRAKEVLREMKKAENVKELITLRNEINARIFPSRFRSFLN